MRLSTIIMRKKFVADLDFFRNHLGLTTRDGKHENEMNLTK